MKTKNILLLIFAAMTVASCSKSERGIRIMSYSVNNCLGLDSVMNCPRIADIIISEAPDVVALQALDSMTTRFPQFTLGKLAELTSLFASYGPATPLDAGNTGVGILSKEKPIRTRFVRLNGNTEGSGMLVAEFRHFVFASIAMPKRQSDQISSIAIIREEAAKTGKPFFFGGNLNARIGSQTISTLAKDFTALTDIGAKSYPADQPVGLTDYIFMYNRNLRSFSLGASAVLNEPVASDHRPVVANLSFR